MARSTVLGSIALLTLVAIPAERPLGAPPRVGAAHIPVAAARDETGVLSFEKRWEARIGATTRGGTDGVLVDLDRDGRLDVLVTSRSREDPVDVIAIDGASGERLWKRTFDGRTETAVCDVGGDGMPDVAAACGRELVVLDGATGATAETAPLPGTIGALAVGGLDGDGVPDLVYTAGVERDEHLVALSGEDLSEIWSIEAAPGAGRFAEGFGRLALADLDGDAIDEVLVIENMNVLVCLDQAGRRRWSTVLGKVEGLVPEGAASTDPLASDLLGDGAVEVAVGCYAGSLVVIDGATGEVLLKTPPFGRESHDAFVGRRRLARHLRELLARVGEPLLAAVPVDLDGAGGNDLVLSCADGHVYAVNPRTGALIWTFRSTKTVHHPAVLLETTGDGVPDLFVWGEDAVHHLNGRDGSEIRVRGLPPTASPARLLLGDLDGDGEIEAVFIDVREDRVAVWSTGAACARAPEAPGCE